MGRFQLKPHDLWHDGTIARVLAEFRDGLPMGEAGLRDTLSTNVESRLEDLNEGLEFISAETHVAADRAAALAESQRFTLAEIKRSPPYRGTPPRLDEPTTIQQLDVFESTPAVFESTPARIRNSSDSLAGFRI
jgi:hypothetical protein